MESIAERAPEVGAEEWKDLKRVQAAAARAVEQGEPLYLVTSESDEKTFEHRWGKVAVYVPQYHRKKGIGAPARLIAEAVDGVCQVVVVRNPEEMSLGRLTALAQALEKVSNLEPGRTLRAFQAPPLSLCEPGDQHEHWDEDNEFQQAKLRGHYRSATDAWYDDFDLDGLEEIDPFAARSLLGASEEAGKELNREWAVIIVEGRTRILHETTDPDGRSKIEFFTKEAAAQYLENRCFFGEDGKPRQVFRPWMADPARRTYKGVAFDPSKPPEKSNSWWGPVAEEGRFYNIYKGHRFPVPDEGYSSYTLFEEHLRENVCGGDPQLRDWLWAWMCNLIREPARRPGTALVLRGKQGVGKTIVGEVLGHLLHPDHYAIVERKEQLVGRFNSHLAHKLLVQAEEATWAGDKEAAAILKALVTQKTWRIEPKGIDSFEVRNYARLIMTSNLEWVVPAGLEERRFAVLDVGEGWMQDREAFAAMIAQLEAGGYEDLLYDLMHDDLDGYPDPAIIPNTAALREQKIHSLDTVGRWWHGCLCAGQVSGHDDDWPREVGCDALYNEYCTAARLGKTVDRGAFGKRLKELCPGIERIRPRDAKGDRAYAYALPSLEVCRGTFEVAIGGEIPWS